MWVGESMLAGGGGTWLAQVAPLDASTLEIVVRSIVGGLIGLIVAVIAIFVFNLIGAPYHQRNEARQLYRQLKEEKTKAAINLVIGGVLINGDDSKPSLLMQMTVSATMSGSRNFVTRWQGFLELNGCEYDGVYLLGRKPLKGSIDLPSLENLTNESFKGIRHGILLFQVPLSTAVFDKYKETATFGVKATDSNDNEWETKRTYLELAKENITKFKTPPQRI